MKDNTPTIELLLNSSVENESVPPYSSSNDPTNVGNASTYSLAHNISNQNNEENMPPSIGSSESNRAAPNLNFMPINNNYNNSGSNINNNDNVKLPSNFKTTMTLPCLLWTYPWMFPIFLVALISSIMTYFSRTTRKSFQFS